MADAGSQTAEPRRFPGVAAIEAYGNGGFRFAGMSHRGSILCLPDGMEAWNVASLEALRPDTLGSLLARKDTIDLVLIGTGFEHRAPPAETLDALRQAGLGFDVMSTGAAARTWNVLIAEGRPIAAALIAVD